LKPDQRAFNAIVSGLNANPSKTVYIGDDFHADVVGSTAFGLKALWTWAFREKIKEKSFHLAKNICVAKTPEEYFTFLENPNEFLINRFNHS